MNFQGARHFRVGILCVLAALAVSSCALFQRRPPRVLEAAPGSGLAPLAVAARFVAPDDKVPGFFKKALADSFVLAVQVVIRNDGPDTLLIHSQNGMRIGPGFEGVRLVCGADTLAPLHPGEVTAILIGARRARRYGAPGAVNIVASTFVAPLGIHTIYQEVSVGRFYRPLFSHSLFTALRSGLFAPIALEPGAERRGWLYFEAPPGAREEGSEILLRACRSATAPKSLPGYDFEFSRAEWPAGGEAASHADREAAGGYLFSLVREGKWSGLFCLPVRSLIGGAAAAAARVGTVASKEAVIADAACRGRRAAVGINFTSKSRAIALECGEAPAMVDDRALPRGIRRVFPLPEGMCVITETGHAHFFGGERDEAPGAKLTRGFDDAALIDERLLVFARDKGLLTFSVASRPRFGPGEKRALPRGRRGVVGTTSDALVLLCRGAPLAGDTLVFHDPATALETRRGALAGRVLRAAASPASVVLQLEDGTVLRIVPSRSGGLRIAEAGWLPFAARTLAALPEDFVAVGGDGSFVSGRIGSFLPGGRGLVDASARIE